MRRALTNLCFPITIKRLIFSIIFLRVVFFFFLCMAYSVFLITFYVWSLQVIVFSYLVQTSSKYKHEFRW